MRIAGLFLALAVSPFAFSGEIVVGHNIDILAINGVEIKRSFLGSDDIKVKDGSQQIVVKYIDTFGRDDFIESRPYIFNIEVKGKTTIKTDKITNKSHASQKIASGLNWHVTNSNNQYTIKNSEQLIGTGFLPYSDMEGLIATYNQTNNTNINTPVVNNGKSGSSKNALIAEYQKATKAQKKQFKIWLIENETK